MPRKAESARELPRLVQQPDGYAYYVEDVHVPQPDGGGKAARSRRGRGRGRRRQRPIRTTITLLLIIPLLSLVGLWGYSFATTIGGYVATQNNAVVNDDAGGQLQALLGQLNQEAALTYLLYNMPQIPAIPSPGAGQKGQNSSQAAQGGSASQTPGASAGAGAGAAASASAGGSPGAPSSQMPSPSQLQKLEQEAKQVQAQTAVLNKQLKAQRPKTDAAIAAFDAAEAKLDKTGDLPAQAKPLEAALLAKLKTIPALRAEADSRKTSPLTVFEHFNAVTDTLFPYVAATANSQSPVPQFSQAMGTFFMGEAVTDVAIEATLGDGAEESGGTLSASAYQLFAQTVAAQRQLDSSGSTMLNFRNASGNDPYLKAIESGPFKSFQTLEDQIIAAGPNSKLPATVTPQSWQQQTQAILGLLDVGETGERTTVTSDTTHQTDVTEYQTFGIGGLGLILVLIASLLLLRFGRRVSKELQVLSETARWLPGVVSRLRAGRNLETLEAAEAEAPPQQMRTKTLEVAETAEAFTAVQRTAVEAALKEAMLRKAVNNVFRSLARRNQSLLQRQLKMLDEMERGTDDPDALGQLFRLDHLTTRMRRQAEGLIILSGATPGRGWRGPVQVVEVLRGAIGEIEDYARVDLSTDSHDYLQGAGVADVIHLLAELIENAVVYSPPGTRVQVRGVRVARGYAVEVEDRGLGIHEEIRETLNQRLAEPPDFDVADSDQLGLFVVSRLAARHGIKVSLRPSAYGGTTAIVLLPQSLVVTAEEAAYLAAQEHGGAPGQGGGPVSWTGGQPVSWPGGAGPASWSAGGPVGNGAFGNGSGSWPVPAGATTVDALTSGQSRPDNGSFPQPHAAPTGPTSSADTFPDGMGPGGLPQRRRTNSGSPQPRREPANPMRGPGPAPGSSPEQARALLTSIQRGLRSGRETDVGNGEVPPGWGNQ